MTAANVIYVRGLRYKQDFDNITIGMVKIASSIFAGTDCIVSDRNWRDTWVSFVAQGNNQSIGNVDVQDITSGTSDITLTGTYFAPA